MTIMNMVGGGGGADYALNQTIEIPCTTSLPKGTLVDVDVSRTNMVSYSINSALRVPDSSFVLIRANSSSGGLWNLSNDSQKWEYASTSTTTTAIGTDHGIFIKTAYSTNNIGRYDVDSETTTQLTGTVNGWLETATDTEIVTVTNTERLTYPLTGTTIGEPTSEALTSPGSTQSTYYGKDFLGRTVGRFSNVTTADKIRYLDGNTWKAYEGFGDEEQAVVGPITDGYGLIHGFVVSTSSTSYSMSIYCINDDGTSVNHIITASGPTERPLSGAIFGDTILIGTQSESNNAIMLVTPELTQTIVTGPAVVYNLMCYENKLYSAYNYFARLTMTLTGSTNVPEDTIGISDANSVHILANIINT